MKPTKFIVIEELGYLKAPNSLFGCFFNQENFKLSIQNLIRERNFVKSVCKEKGMEYTPKTYTLYKLTKVKEFKF